MTEMTTYERVAHMYEHREADRVPMMAGPWESTIVRWRREGLPAEVSVKDYFGLDEIGYLGGIDTSPRFPTEVIEETDTYLIDRDEWGLTKKNFKPVSTTPLSLEHAIRDADTWLEAKGRMTPTRDRIDWQLFDKQYKRLRKADGWVGVAPWFGYDIVNARMVGTETLLLGMADDPEWVKDMLDHICDLALALADMVWEAGYTFDELMWFDDMGYRNGLLFSKEMWREMVRSYQLRTIDWAHRHGIKAHLHSCGNIMALVPELVGMGLDALNPMEVKAGMDPVGIKGDFGSDLLLRGGFDARNWNEYDDAEKEIRSKLPTMMKGGGYIFASDHSIPDSVSLDTYARIVELVKDVGAYG